MAYSNSVQIEIRVPSLATLIDADRTSGTGSGGGTTGGGGGTGVFFIYAAADVSTYFTGSIAKEASIANFARNASTAQYVDWSGVLNRPTSVFDISSAADFSTYFTGTKANEALIADYVHWNNVGSKPLEFPPTPDSSYYIRNQYTYAQDASLWIKGTITSDVIKSSGTFVSGFGGAGTKLDLSTNHLTVDRLTVRGQMDVYELVINKIRASNGAIWVSDAVKIDSLTTNAPAQTQRCYVGDNTSITFAVNDVVRAQNFSGNNVRVGNGIVNLVGANYFDVYYTLGQSFWQGAEVVRIGNTTNSSRQGSIYLTSSDTNSPYIDVLDGITSSSWSSGNIKVRIGRLDGITDANFGALSGYGLYTQNGYFTGTVNITGGNGATKTDVSTAKTSAIGTAALDASTKALAAQNTAISTAALDASTKALAAQNTAISTAALDASAKAASAQATAISTAALDASAKAATAQYNAQTFTTNSINTLKTTYLGDLAVLDTLDGGLITNATVELAKLGTTVISGGYIKTSLLDATAIKSTIINTGYIEGLSLNFTQGYIGGWQIDASALKKENGSYSAGLSPYDYPFYSGKTYANRATAPFRVATDGEVNINSKCLIKNVSTNCEVLMGGTEFPFGFGSGALYAYGTTTNTALDTNAIYAEASGGFHNYGLWTEAHGGDYNTALKASAYGGVGNTAAQFEGAVTIQFGGLELKTGTADGNLNGAGITLDVQEPITAINQTMSSGSRIFVINITGASNGDCYLPYISHFKIGEMIYITNMGTRNAYVKSNTTDNATINGANRADRWLTMYNASGCATLFKQSSTNWGLASYSNCAF